MELNPYACCKVQSPMPQSVSPHRCHDWPLHDGNIHYVRPKDKLVSFKPVLANAHIIESYSDGRPSHFTHIAVAGIGTLKHVVNRQLSQNSTHEIELHSTLYIPDAPCNGISLLNLTKDGFHFKRNKIKPDQRWSIKRLDGHRPSGCGTSGSGRRRFLLPKENDMASEPQHDTVGKPIDISADLTHISDMAKNF